VLAVGITWLTTKHPWIAAAIATTLIVCAIAAAQWIVRLLSTLWKRTPAAATPAPGPDRLLRQK